VHVRIDRAESASAERAPSVGLVADAVAPSIAAQQLRSGESAPQGGSPPPIISLISAWGSDAHYGVRGMDRVHDSFDRAKPATLGRARSGGSVCGGPSRRMFPAVSER
jgi:hypothetical protein